MWEKKDGKEVLKQVINNKEVKERLEEQKNRPVTGQNDEYIKDVLSGLKLKSTKNSQNYIYSKNKSLVACPSPFTTGQIIIMGLKFPVKGVIVAQMVPDPTYPTFGKQPYGLFFPPNDSLNKTLISFEGIREAFGMPIGMIYQKLSNDKRTPVY